MDLKKIFDEFIGGVDYRWDYLSAETKAYANAIDACYNENPSEFTKYPFKYPKTALGR